MNIKDRIKRRRPALAALWLGLTLALVLAAPPLAPAQPGAGDHGPLTQADIDAYIYLTPRLTAELAADPARASQLLRDARTTRQRMVYVGAKVAIAQAMAIGAMSPQQLQDNNVPLYLHPSPEEVSLVHTNLVSITNAQDLARNRAAGAR